MSVVQVLQKKRSSSQQSHHPVSRSTSLFPVRTLLHQNGKKIRSSNSSQLHHSEARNANLGSVARHQKTLTHGPKVSVSTHIGNLTTNYRQEQEIVKQLQKRLIVESRAYKEAQRNSKAANQDLNNAIAESHDRHVRLDEVIEVYKECKQRASCVESDQRLLRSMISKAKYDVGSANTLMMCLASKKKHAVSSILAQFRIICEKSSELEKFVKDSELSFKHLLMQHQSELDLKSEGLRAAHVSIESLKEINVKLASSTFEDQKHIEELKVEISVLESVNSKRKSHVQDVKTTISSDGEMFQDVLSDLQKQVKALMMSKNVSISSVNKVSADESRLVNQHSTLAEEVETKEAKLKSASVDFSSKLKSLTAKIENLESSHGGLVENIERLKCSLENGKKEEASLVSEIKSCEDEIASASTHLSVEETRLESCIDSIADDEASLESQILMLRKNDEELSENICSSKMELNELELRLETTQNKEICLQEACKVLDIETVEISLNLKSVEIDFEALSMEARTEAASTGKMETELKATTQSKQAALISLHIEEQEIESKLKVIDGEKAKMVDRLNTLMIPDCSLLPSDLKNELLPPSEIQAIRDEVCKRQAECEKPSADIDIDRLINEEKDRLKMFNERKETIRNNHEMQLKGELQNIDERIKADSKLLAETLEAPNEVKGFDVIKAEEELDQLQNNIQQVLSLLEKKQYEMDSVVEDIEQISSVVCKNTSDELKKADTMIDGVEEGELSEPLDNDKCREPSSIKSFKDPSVYPGCRKAVLATKTSNLDIMNYGDDEAEVPSPVLSKRASTKRKKRPTTHRSVSISRHQLDHHESDGGNHDENKDIFSTEFDVPKQCVQVDAATKLHGQFATNGRKKKDIKPSQQQDHHSRKQETYKEARSTGPHIIAGEDEEVESAIICTRLSSGAKKALPVLVPLDEKHPFSRGSDRRQKLRKPSESRKTKYNGVSRSRSPIGGSQRGLKPKENKRNCKKSKVTQEADWLFSSQDGFSF